MRTFIPKQQPTRFPLLVDLVQENLRSRILFPLCALLLYVLIVVSVTNVEETFEEPPAEIKQTLPFKDSYKITDNFTGDFPAPRIKVSNQAGPMEGISVSIQTTDVLIKNDPSMPNCDTMTRTSIAGTLEYIRLMRVCGIVLVGETTTTNQYGLTDFQNFTIQRGPQGNYFFVYKSVLYPTSSQEFTFFMKSNVGNIEVDPSTPPPFTASIGEVLTPGPLIKVYDEDGNPIQGKNVVAFSWPEPQFSGKQLPYLSHPNKYAYLEGNIVVSNDKGEALFKDLKIMGSNSQYVYIFFSVDGLVVTNWGEPQPYYGKLLDITTVYNSPIRLNKRVGQLEIVDMPFLAVEGSPFKTPPQIQVTDVSGNPLANVMVMARITYANGFQLPQGFPKYEKNKPNKQLLYPIPGQYGEEFLDPLQHQNFIPMLTQEDGTVEFEKLRFSVYGPAGEYQILFEAEGVEVESQKIKVLSTVDVVKFFVEPVSYLNTQDFRIQDKVNPILVVYDSLGYGIQGQVPTIRILDSTTNLEISQDILDIRLQYNLDAFEPSNEAGFIQLLFKNNFISKPKISIKFEATIENVVAISREITIESLVDDTNSQCGTIKVLQYPTRLKTTEETDSSNHFQFQVISTKGEPLPSQRVYLNFQFISSGITQFPSGIFPSPSKVSTPDITNSVGEVTIPFKAMNQGSEGNIDLTATTYTLLGPFPNEDAFQELLMRATTSSEDRDELQLFINDSQANGLIKVCRSKQFSIFIESKTQVVQIVSFNDQPYSLQSKEFTTIVEESVTNKVKLRFFNQDGSLVQNQPISVDFKYLQRPPYTLYTNSPQSITFKQPTVTDSNGELVADLKVEDGYYGLYAIIFSCDGTSSDALLFQVKMPSLSLNINQDTGYPQDENGADLKIVEAGNLSQLVDVQVNVGSAPKPNVNVIISLKDLAAIRDQAIIDITDLGSGFDALAVYSQRRVVITGVSGIARFDGDVSGPTILNVRTEPCVKFQFNVGLSSSLYSQVSVDSTKDICFKELKIVEISDKKYSRMISQGNQFPTPLNVRITKGSKTVMDTKGLVIVSAVPIVINSYSPKLPYDIAGLYLTNVLCIYNEMKAVGASARSCSQTINIQGNYPYFFDVSFTNLAWIQSAQSTKFKLSISDPLNYARTTTRTSDDGTPVYQIVQQMNSVETDFIEVSNTPSILQIKTQPPEIVTVNEIFPVTIACKIANGSPVVRASIRATITPDPGETQNYSLSQMKDAIFTLASGSVDAESLGKLTKQSNVEFDDNTKVKKTNRKGQATFNLKIIAGMPGKYTLTFQVGKIKSDRSISFSLVNWVQKIQFSKQPESKFQVNLNENQKPSQFTIQPKLLLTFQNNLIFFGDQKFEVRVYKYIDPAEIANAQQSVEDAQTKGMEVLMEDYQSQDQVLKESAFSTLQTFGNAVLNGGKLIKNVQNNYEKLNITFSTPIENVDGTIEFTNLAIGFENYGQYMLMVLVNGIESDASAPFEVVQLDQTPVQVIFSSLEIVAVVSLVICTLISNTADNRFLWVPFSIIINVISIILLYLADKPLLWKIFAYIVMGLILLVNLWVVIKKIIKKEKALYHFHHRENLFFEYTFQMLNLRPSIQWINSKRKNTLYEPYVDQAKENQELKAISEEQQQEEEIVDPIFIPNLEILKDQYQNTDGFGKKIQMILTPFSQTYEKDIVVVDCFFYPQRLWAGTLLSFVSIAYFSYLALTLIGGIRGAISVLNSKLQSANALFMFSALNAMKSAFTDAPFSEQSYQKSQEAVNFIVDQLTILGAAMQTAFYVSAGLCALLFILALILMFFNYQSRFMGVRAGNYSFDKTKISIVTAANFIGTQVSNSAVSYLINLFLFGLIFTIIFHPLFWKFLGENIEIILGLLLSVSLLVSILQFLAVKFLTSPAPYHGIKHRRLWSIYELIMLYLAIISGLLTALGRIITLIVFSLFGLIRLDEPLFPDWILAKLYLDDTHLCYLSTLYMMHLHNHPIFVTFANLMFQEWERKLDQGEDSNQQLDKVQQDEKERQEKEKKELSQKTVALGVDPQAEKAKQEQPPKIPIEPLKRLRNLLGVALILTKNPSLAKLRKAYLVQEKRKKEQLAKGVKREKTLPQEENKQSDPPQINDKQEQEIKRLQEINL